MAMYRKQLVPDDFEIPKGLWLKSCTIKPLTLEHVELDYAAVIDNLDEEGNPFSPSHTLYQNTIDLGYHQKEFQKRSSFAYTILGLSEDECIGCIYIYPCDEDEFDVEVDMWIRSRYSSIEVELVGEVRSWIEKDWPFPFENIKWSDCFNN